MKKLTTLVLAAGLVVSAFAGSASAGEFKPNAQFAEEFVYGDAGSKDAENFTAATRIRFGFDYVASEDLSATMLFQYRHHWGQTSGDFTADPEVTGVDNHFRMRLAYIDWTIPGTEVKVRMGRQPLVTPSYAFGSPILDGRGDAISVNGAINENISLGFAWLALDSDRGADGFKDNDDANALMLNAEFAYDGFKVAPWAMYVSGEKGSMFSGSSAATYKESLRETNPGTPADGYYKHYALDKDAEPGYAYDAYVLGLSAELNMFDPFVFAVDALYNNIQYHDPSKDMAEDSFDGWYVGAKGSYKLTNGTVALGAWYASGSDTKNGKESDNAFILLDGGFNASTMLYGDNIIGADDYNTLTGDTPFGTWGVVAEYAGFSFVENLTHTARVVYVEGTNEVDRADYKFDFGALTDDDTLVEIDFNSTYQIYKNLSATLELGYIFVDQASFVPAANEEDDIFRSALTFVYKF